LTIESAATPVLPGHGATMVKKGSGYQSLGKWQRNADKVSGARRRSGIQESED